ncbi:MAG: DUF4910 domain-containing protein [Erysipelotrichaceae bacterium]|nr:DUF4910 domain-containing protein [Erysipelotrichaceae bacterium]
MIRNTVKTLWSAISKERMMADLRAIAPYERYPGSKGFHQAALYCENRLKQDGFETCIHTYPFSRDTLYQTALCEDVWDCEEAWCELVEDDNRRIADYAGNKASVTMLSGSCEKMKEPVEVVLLDKGPDQKNYKGLDLKGKVLLVKGRVTRDYLWVYKERGAIGAIMIAPSVYNSYEAISWTSLRRSYWDGFFGFAVSPKEGQRLIDLYQKLLKEGKGMHVNCTVKAVRRAGTMEVVDAFLPGESDEEVLIVAHLCHPQNSCNDNLSGCVAGMEALRAIRQEIAAGRLEPLKRGIRLLLVPEMFGSFGFLQENKKRWSKIKAGINLDMVGASQDGHNGPLSLSETPRSLPSFIGALGELILDELKRDEALYNNRVYVPLFNALLVEYRGGSDHAIFCDPAVNIPMVMLGQMPDRYYHSDHDTPEIIDPFILAKSSTLAAGFVYLLANLDTADAFLIIQRLFKTLLTRLDDTSMDRWSDSHLKDWYQSRVNQYTRYYYEASESLSSYFTDSEGTALKMLVKIEQVKMLRLMKERADSKTEEPQPELMDPKYQRVPKRNFWGNAFYLLDDAYDLTERILHKPEALKKLFERIKPEDLPNPSEHLVSYYINGKRNEAEIIHEVCTEIGGQSSPEAISAFIDYLADLGFVSFVKKKNRTA